MSAARDKILADAAIDFSNSQRVAVRMNPTTAIALAGSPEVKAYTASLRGTYAAHSKNAAYGLPDEIDGVVISIDDTVDPKTNKYAFNDGVRVFAVFPNQAADSSNSAIA